MKSHHKKIKEKELEEVVEAPTTELGQDAVASVEIDTLDVGARSKMTQNLQYHIAIVLFFAIILTSLFVVFEYIKNY